MTPGGFRTDPDRIDGHAGEVAALAAAVDAARLDRTDVTLDAYGLVGRQFAGAVAAPMAAVDRDVGARVAALRRLAAGLRAAAVGYRAAEDGHTRHFIGVVTPPPPGPVRT